MSRYFTSMPRMEEVLAESKTETSCRTSAGITATLRVVDKKSFPCALVYFTGSREHWARLPALAQIRGLALNERGLFEGERPLEAQSEADVYDRLGLHLCRLSCGRIWAR